MPFKGQVERIMLRRETKGVLNLALCVCIVKIV